MRTIVACCTLEASFHSVAGNLPTLCGKLLYFWCRPGSAARVLQRACCSLDLQRLGAGATVMSPSGGGRGSRCQPITSQKKKSWPSSSQQKPTRDRNLTQIQWQPHGCVGASEKKTPKKKKKNLVLSSILLVFTRPRQTAFKKQQSWSRSKTPCLPHTI